MIRVEDLFEVKYGVNLELNSLTPDPNGVNFVSRTSRNNGVSAKVQKISNLEPIPAGTISVAAGGSVMATFLQPYPYYSGRDIYYLSARTHLTDNQKLFYCYCLYSNKYRFNYGRQANRSIRELLIPSPIEIPNWVNSIKNISFDNAQDSFSKNESYPREIDSTSWKEFTYEEIFDIRKGKRLTKANMTEGLTPFIGSVDKNNGITHFIGQSPNHEGNTISVNYNGSVAEAFYQPVPFWACDDVNVLYPKFEMNQYVGMFIVAVIKKEKYRFNYGRKWHLGRMQQSKIKLPVNDSGQLNLAFMENYIKTLPFSSTF